MSFAKIGRQWLYIFVWLLPWSVLMSVFWGDELGLSIFRFWKEVFLIFLFGVFLIDIFRKKYRFTWDTLDALIGGYILWMIIISALNHLILVSYIYGLRYDAEFLITFVFLRRAIPLWDISFASLAKVFLVSGGIMLTMSVLVRYIFWETLLTIFGFNSLIGSADAGGPPPIYHDIDGSSIIRFQGVLEGPNQMAFFLLVYMSFYATMFMRSLRTRVISTAFLVWLGFLFLETYSRSAYIGIIVGAVSICGLSFFRLLRSDRYVSVLLSFLKKIFIPFLILLLVFLGVLFQFRGQFYNIFTRHGSTSGHFERMAIGLTRFREAPMGTGLAQAGPASRLVTLVTDRPIVTEITDPVMKALTVKLKKENPDFYFSTSNFYIPESWYVQQLVEGGVIACFLLLAFLSIVLVRLSRYPYLFGAFLGVMIMNIFLHSFESVHTVLALFTLLSAILPVHTSRVSMSQVVKYLFAFFLFLLPWHALIVTFFQCKVHVDATLFRFWKEFFVGIFFVFTSGYILSRHTNIFTWYRKQSLLFWTVLFLISSLVYIFFPGWVQPQSLLGFRYDTFFLLTLVIGLYLPMRDNHRFFLKVLFTSTGLMLSIFLVWYLFFDISTTTEVFGFSHIVSTFHPESCLAFAQNVAGHHRLQGTFGGPIRFSVFIVITYILFLGFIFTASMKSWIKNMLLLIASILAFVAIFYSYSKTSYLGITLWLGLFSLLVSRFYSKKFPKKYILWLGVFAVVLLSGLVYFERSLFVHAGAMIVRQDNLSKTWNMFLQKPFGYGLGSAGPASQIHGSTGDMLEFQEASADFLPENWYLQILIEQGIVGLFLFVIILFLIVQQLWSRVKAEKDLYSIALFTAFIALLFMACFTHAFEEAATSYILFLLIGIHLSKNHHLWK